jgi:hypothetical protein
VIESPLSISPQGEKQIVGQLKLLEKLEISTRIKIYNLLKINQFRSEIKASSLEGGLRRVT